MLVKDIVNVTNGNLIIGNENLECEDFSRDTRTIKQGDIYIGIKGENFDGNLFWKEALNNGADAVIVQNIDFLKEDLTQYERKTIILVDDTLEALYNIASLKRKMSDVFVIAVTGSVGKTSTKDMIASVVSQKYKTLKAFGNNNNNIGMSFTILNLKDEDVLVLEMGMNHLGEISLLSKIARPNICVITNIGTAHIGNLGSRENILKAKLEILDGAEKDSILIINNDNDLLHNWYENNKENKKILTYGIYNSSNIKANNIELDEESSKFTCDFNGKSMSFLVPVGGEHFILNSLCSILVGDTLNIEYNKIKDGIENFELTQRRMDITTLENGIKIINDAYNASFESMQATLKQLKKYNTRKIAVLGDMLELGDFSEELHRKVGKEVANQNIDILICSGDSSKFIAEEAKNSGMNSKNIYELQYDEILNFLKDTAKENDIILFKASNGMKFFELAEKAKEELK